MAKICARIFTLCMLFTSMLAQAQDYEYKVRYGLIAAGNAHLSQKLVNGILTSHLITSSSPWLSNLWTLSDSIQSEFEVESSTLLRHIKAIHEGGYHRNYNVVFNDSDRVSVNGVERDLEWQGMLDIPSLLYVLSTCKFHVGDTLRYLLWDGRSFGALELLVQKQEATRSLLRPFGKEEDSWQLIPISSTRKSRENGIQLSIQLSQGYPHIPERIEIDTKFGDIQMRLSEP